MIMEIAEFLNQNEYDLNLATNYFKIPFPLFNKILLSAINLQYIDEKTREGIKGILNKQENKKTK